MCLLFTRGKGDFAGGQEHLLVGLSTFRSQTYLDVVQ